MTTSNNAALATKCFADFNKHSWGYSRTRIYLGDTNINSYPNNFSGFGYKDENGRQMLGLRWNKFPARAPKFRVYYPGDNIIEKWSRMIEEFKQEEST